jgi:putative transposase
VTTRTWESRNIFTKPPACELFIESLLLHREKGAYLLHSFVLMPDHLHILITPGSNIALERAVQFIKGGSARRIAQQLNFRFPVWQRGYTDHRIRDAQDYKTHLQYIEQNPVKELLSLSPTDYPWSSACQRYPLDECPQGLKPLPIPATFGTVETVPFLS